MPPNHAGARKQSGNCADATVRAACVEGCSWLQLECSEPGCLEPLKLRGMSPATTESQSQTPQTLHLQASHFRAHEISILHAASTCVNPS